MLIDELSHTQLGEIKIKISRVIIVGEVQPSYFEVSEVNKVHERAKKAVTHKVSSVIPHPRKEPFMNFFRFPQVWKGNHWYWNKWDCGGDISSRNSCYIHFPLPVAWWAEILILMIIEWRYTNADMLKANGIVPHDPLPDRRPLISGFPNPTGASTSNIRRQNSSSLKREESVEEIGPDEEEYRKKEAELQVWSRFLWGIIYFLLCNFRCRARLN